MTRMTRKASTPASSSVTPRQRSSRRRSGLAAAAVERLFEAFYTTKPTGLGMGLSICRSIIEAHGGRLWVEANEPRGAIFQFLTPVQP
jgi:signal transduction histidine kinase